MPWNDQSGGGNRGPWGQGPSGGRNQPPDLDDLIRRGQEKLRNAIPGGPGAGVGGFMAVAGVVVALLVVWSSFFRVDTDQQGIVLRFGTYVRSAPPGLHMKLPYPIETVQKPVVTRINQVDVGMRGSGNAVPEEGLMLTGDESIVDINFSFFWRIKDAPAYLFNVDDPDRTAKALAESAMREVVGTSNIQALLTTGRGELQTKVHGLMQQALDAYGAGIEITEVKLQNSNPPATVIDAFRDVQAARADQERLQFEANTYANQVVPRARGESAQITQAAEAYREQTVAEAQGQAKRFDAIYAEYKNAKEVTRRRMYLETMEAVLGKVDKIVIDPAAGKNVVPYLPLPELKNSGRAAASAPAQVETAPQMDVTAPEDTGAKQ